MSKVFVKGHRRGKSMIKTYVRAVKRSYGQKPDGLTQRGRSGAAKRLNEKLAAGHKALGRKGKRAIGAWDFQDKLMARHRAFKPARLSMAQVRGMKARLGRY